jgi:hypothetical protein
MPASTRRSAARFAVAQAVLLVAAVTLTAQPPEPGKKATDSSKPAPPPPALEKDPPKPSPTVGLPLPDGTFLWTGPNGPARDADRVWISQQELQKLLDQVDQLKKQLATRKASAPSGCAIRGRVEKRGEALVAALTATYSFRTTAPNSAITIGLKRAFLVAAKLDGNTLPALDSGEDGFAVLVETPGEHALTVSLEAGVVGRGTKTEIGFEFGLPRAAITTLTLNLPPGVSRVTLSTRILDPTQPGKPPETRRIPGMDVKQLAPKPGAEEYPLGPVESVEVTWDPPAAVPTDPALSADWEIRCQLAEGFVETTAKVLPRGTARGWRIVAPADAVLSFDRATPAARESGSESVTADLPTITKPPDANKPVWKIDFPVGSSAADWAVTAVVRSTRPKVGNPKHKGPFSLGPFAALGVSRQTGTIRITAAVNTRLTFRHSPDVRQDAPLTPPVDETVALFRFATGPTGDSVLPGTLLDVEASPLTGAVQIQPAYRMLMTESGWQVRADIRVLPIRREVDTVLIELPADWRGAVVSPPEVVDGVQLVKAEGQRQGLLVRLAAGHRQPFVLVLTALAPVPAGAREAAVLLPRFPGAGERDTTLTVSVPEGLEVRGVGRGWDGDQPAGWGQSLAPSPGPDGKPPRPVTTVVGKFENGLARVDLEWSPFHPELTADVRAEVVVSDGQVVVTERVRLRAPEGFSKPVRFLGPVGPRELPPLSHRGPGEWTTAPAPDLKEMNLSLTYVLPLPTHPGDATAPWTVPIGLLWPTFATRTESVVMVWSSATVGRSIRADTGTWRELPPEPTPGRVSLPSLTLAGSGSELPLVLTLTDNVDPATVTGWVDRGLVQVWVEGDDSATFRTRFLFTRWLADGVEVDLPDGVLGTDMEVWIDGRKTDPVPAGGRAIRITLPAARPGRTAVVEIRYHLAPGRAGSGAILTPPRPRVAFDGPVRWQVTVPARDIPLVSGGGPVDQRWTVRSGLFVPLGASTDELERWFITGNERGDEAGLDGAAVFRVTGSAPVRVYHISRVGLIVICSVAVLIVGLVVTRLPSAVAGPVVALLGGAAAVAAIVLPQPAGQVAAAAEPGVATLALVLSALAAARWLHRRRVTYLPGFTRTRPDPGVASNSAIQPSSRSRPSPNGSTGPHEVVNARSVQPAPPSAS